MARVEIGTSRIFCIKSIRIEYLTRLKNRVMLYSEVDAIEYGSIMGRAIERAGLLTTAKTN